MSRTVTTWFLEMGTAEQLRPATPPTPRPEVTTVPPDPAMSRSLYTAVGKDWSWVDRLRWTDRQWQEWVGRPGYEMWVARADGNLAGYLELDDRPAGDVEVAYFGLLPRFVGRGIGGHLLSVAVAAAWGRGASRVWLHTCSLDGPHARRNYEARGFRVYDHTTERRS